MGESLSETRFPFPEGSCLTTDFPDATDGRTWPTDDSEHTEKDCGEEIIFRSPSGVICFPSSSLKSEASGVKPFLIRPVVE